MSSIQTQGFQVQEMPRYTPVDPKMVSPDPQRINEGLLQAFNIASDFDKLKAFKMQQDELNQLRDERIAAAKSGYRHDTAKANALTSLIPKETELSALKTGFEVEQAPTLQGTARIANKAALEAAPKVAEKTVIDADTAALDADTNRTVKTQTQGADIETAMNKAELDADALRNAREVQGPEFQLKKKKLADAIANAQTDADRERLMADMKILETKESAAMHHEQAEYLKIKSPGGATPHDRFTTDMLNYDKWFKQMESKVLESPMWGGDYTLGEYMKDRAKGKVAIDPSAEQDLEIYQHYKDRQRDVILADKSARAAGTTTTMPVRPQLAAPSKPASDPSSVKFNPAPAIDKFDTPATGQVSFTSLGEAQAALKAGQLLAGTKITVNGKSYTAQ